MDGWMVAKKREAFTQSVKRLIKVTAENVRVIFEFTTHAINSLLLCRQRKRSELSWIWWMCVSAFRTFIFPLSCRNVKDDGDDGDRGRNVNWLEYRHKLDIKCARVRVWCMWVMIGNEVKLPKTLCCWP